MDAMRNRYVLAVLSVGSRSGFIRSGSGRVEDIFASINGVTRCVEVDEARSAA